MDINVQHSEEQLRNTLHCDDKEKLRRKLAQLQREYLKTAQRLQRAERLEAVQRHVRSRISQQKHQELEATSSSSSSIQNANNAVAQGLPPRQAHTEGPADSDTSRRNQVIRFMLPPDAACPQTADPGNDAAVGYRASPTLRLRSRRSRLRLERRSAEAGNDADSNQQGQQQEGKVESAKTVVEEEGTVEAKGGDEANGSEELFSATESPSLLLTHCNTQGHTETGDVLGKENLRGQEQQAKEADLTTEERGENGTQNEETNAKTEEDGARSEEVEEKKAHMENGEKNVPEKTCENLVKIKEEENGITREGKAASLLDSCTLVEGLLFPAEYYVRTTRRMTFSQSQPDMQAVILSQLSMGRHRRSQGRGRGSNRDSQTRGSSDQHTQTDFSSPTTPSSFLNPLNSPQARPADTAVECSQSSGDTSNPVTAHQMDTPPVTVTRPPRGKRRRRRGRGRGRPQTSRAPQPPVSSVSSSQSVHEADGADTCLGPVKADSESGGTQPSSTHSSSSKVNGAAERVQKVFPIFQKSSITTSRQVNTGTSNYQSLLLPSSSSPAQTSHLPPPPPLFPVPLVGSLKSLDTHQDFHLPDDQFASLKLHKLRQVAVESGVEHFSAPSHNTRSSFRCADSPCSIGDLTTLLSLPLSVTPTVTDPACPDDEEQQTQLRDLPSAHILTDDLICKDSTQEVFENNNPETNVEQQLHAETQDSEDCGHPEHEAVTPDSQSRSCISTRSTHRSTNSDKLNPQQSFLYKAPFKGNDSVTGHSDELKEQLVAKKQTDYCGLSSSSEDQMTRYHQVENRAATETLLFDHSQDETQEKPSNVPASLQTCNKAKVAHESPVQNKNVQCSFDEPELNPNLSEDRLTHCSQTVLKSPPASVNCSFRTTRPPSPAPAPSPALPSLGITPHPPLSSSPAAPSLSLPPPHSPSTQALSPPALSPHPSTPWLPPLSPCSHVQGSSEPPAVSDRCHKVQLAASLNPSGGQLHGSPGPGLQTTEDTAEWCIMRRSHTLKAAAGGSLVDACCLPGSSGGLFVAAAGKWAVCLWSQTSASDWSLKHTWTFREPVINVFPVPDAAGLICVTLGQLEIREVRTLSCRSLAETLICEGVMQVVVGLYESRVVTSSHSATGSTLQAFTLSDSSGSWSCQPLVSPGVCVGALAPVDELSDALIGTSEDGHLFIWNSKTGQLLCSVLLGHGLSHTACLRGYSQSGVLLVLLQHHFLNSLDDDDDDEAIIKDQMFSEEETKTALFSLVGINPLSGKSVLATRLCPPKGWSGRLCEADVRRSSVVGLSQSGRICVWELGKQTSRMVEAEDWQLVRWGGEDRLVIGHHNGDVSLRCC
ncbi:partner and localizer of BRCA2 [Kryptolebias marmoratus]|uniref:Partner and localizer of BRCA2 n=1 Tax=Kryptolebias marmoratus TaxID=37003 RepID=A0A3Q3A700_KRYMA|nr:partner and localizer of BRCA2 [Kryptolebias marmoratus]